MLTEPDFSKIRFPTPEDSAAPLDPVQITHFETEGKNLYYVNAEHISLKASGFLHPTCEAIQMAITRFSPEFIIVETYLPENAPYQRKASRAQMTAPDCGEPNYAAHLALKHGIPFAGGELSDSELLREMHQADKEYSARTMRAFYTLRQIPQWRRERTLSPETFESLASRFLQDLERRANVSADQKMTFNEFLNWYDTHNSAKKDILTTTGYDVGPINFSENSYFQKLSCILGGIRERALDTMIWNKLTRDGHNRVLVVYGGGHLKTSRLVFEGMFGNDGIDIPLPPRRHSPSQSPFKGPS